MRKPFHLPRRLKPAHVMGTFKKRRIGLVLLGLLAMVVLFSSWMMLQAPRDFPVGEAIVIKEGTSTGEIISLLKEKGVIRFEAALQFFLVFKHKEDFIQANTYLFPHKLSVLEVARAITEGAYIAPPQKVTIPEGLRGSQMVAVLEESLPEESTPPLSAELFDEHIGYLFPETYYLPHEFTQEELIAIMRETFDSRMAELAADVEASEMTLEEIVTLASIVEREAGDGDTKPMVAGVLLNRLSIGMALQVDAVFYYLLGRTSAELTLTDLQMDTPYNTYTNKGLPPTPIANPGIDSIKAVLHPIETENIYYLTAPDGTFHYAETFEHHKQNKERYLR